jgi:hypothetical protein
MPMRRAVCFVVLLTSTAACVASSDANNAAESHEAPADPFTLAPCAPMGFDDLSAKFPPGEIVAPLATPFTLASRRRARCNAITGCAPWTHGNVQLQNSRAIVEPPRSGFAALLLDPAGTTMSLDLLARDPSPAVRDLAWSHIPPRVRVQCTIADSLACTVALETYELDPFEFATSLDDAAYFRWDGRICTDGTYQLVTKLDPSVIDGAANRNQIAIWGRL